MEVTRHGVVEVIQVRINMNLKTLKVEALESQNRDMHLASFRYQVQQLERDLSGRAEDDFAEFGWSDASPPRWQRSVLRTIRGFRAECDTVIREQEAHDNSRYLEAKAEDEGFYMRMVAEMMKSLSSLVLKGKVMLQTIKVVAPWVDAAATASAPAPPVAPAGHFGVASGQVRAYLSLFLSWIVGTWIGHFSRICSTIPKIFVCHYHLYPSIIHS